MGEEVLSFLHQPRSILLLQAWSTGAAQEWRRCCPSVGGRALSHLRWALGQQLRVAQNQAPRGQVGLGPRHCMPQAGWPAGFSVSWQDPSAAAQQGEVSNGISSSVLQT